MGDSLRSVGTWIGVISFFAAIIALANKSVQSQFLWLCLGCWAAIALFYCFIKLMRAFMGGKIRLAKYDGINKQQFRQLKDKESKLKKKMETNYTPLQQRKSFNFNLPSLAGFAPHRLQKGSNSGLSPSKGFPLEQQKVKSGKFDFKLPSLAGFAPQRLQSPESKNPGLLPSKGFASGQRQKAKSSKFDFDLPPIAGFAPQNLQNPTERDPRQ